MALSKGAKIEVEIIKVRGKLSELQDKLKELEQRKTEIENTEIVEMVRGMSIPLEELGALLQSLRGGAGIAVPTSGRNVQKTAPISYEVKEDSGE